MDKNDTQVVLNLANKIISKQQIYDTDIHADRLPTTVEIYLANFIINAKLCECP